MPKHDPWCDAILGQWSFNDKETKKRTNRGKFVYTRQAEVTLHRDHAVDHLDPTTYKKQKVHGKVVIAETKMIDRQTSDESRFRSLELTPQSVVVDAI